MAQAPQPPVPPQPHLPQPVHSVPWVWVGTRGAEQPPEARRRNCSFTTLHSSGCTSSVFQIPTLIFYYYFFLLFFIIFFQLEVADDPICIGLLCYLFLAAQIFRFWKCSVCPKVHPTFSLEVYCSFIPLRHGRGTVRNFWCQQCC